MHFLPSCSQKFRSPFADIMSFQSVKGDGTTGAFDRCCVLGRGCSMVPKENKPQQQGTIFRPNALRDWNEIEEIVEALASETNGLTVDTLARRLLDALGES